MPEGNDGEYEASYTGSAANGYSLERPAGPRRAQRGWALCLGLWPETKYRTLVAGACRRRGVHDVGGDQLTAVLARIKPGLHLFGNTSGQADPPLRATAPPAVAVTEKVWSRRS